MLDFNKALLAKWGWSLLVCNKFLCLDTLRARYLYNISFFDALPQAGDSGLWKAILSLRDIIREGACYVVGDGRSIDPWKDHWVLNADNFRPLIISDPGLSNCRVKDFFLHQGMWDV